MVATYKGKIIVTPPFAQGDRATFWRTQSVVDELIANDTRWSAFVSQGVGGPPVNALVYDDGSPITDWVLYTDVPDDADFWIVLEPAFYLNPNV